MLSRFFPLLRWNVELRHYSVECSIGKGAVLLRKAIPCLDGRAHRLGLGGATLFFHRQKLSEQRLDELGQVVLSCFAPAPPDLHSNVTVYRPLAGGKVVGRFHAGAFASYAHHMRDRSGRLKARSRECPRRPEAGS